MAKSLPEDLIHWTNGRRRIAREAGLAIMGCLGVLEAATRSGLVPDLREAYIDLLRQGIRL